MTRSRKILLTCSLAVLCVVGLATALIYYFGSDFRERRAMLRPLLATNASLNEIEARAGSFIITRKNTPQWSEMIARYNTGSKWDRHIADKMERASAVGHSSTMWMQTWIFLDEHDRLIDFELGTQ